MIRAAPKWPLALGAGGAVLLIAGITQAKVGKRMAGRKVTIQDVAVAKALVRKWLTVFTRVQFEWAMAVIGNESRFNPDAKNLTGGDLKRGGAWGFMQMTLITAVDIAKRLKASGVPAITVVLDRWDGTGPGLLDPNLNIMLGMAHLNQLAKALNNDPTLVVAAYNRGLGSVQKMVAEGKQANVRQLDYVQNVMAMRDQLRAGGVFT